MNLIKTGAIVLLLTGGVLTACGTMDTGAVKTAPKSVIGIRKSVVYPAAETAPVQSMDDAADDPAIWVDPSAPADSLILGTNKKAGLDVYDLSGARLQFLPVGKVNNVDVRQDVTIGDFDGDIAAASNRTDNTVSVFTIDPDGKVNFEAGLPVGDVPYGFCLGQFGDHVNAIVTQKDGKVRFIRLAHDANGWSGSQVQELRFDSQLEGCVVDDATGTLYVGEEDKGVWQVKTPLDPKPDVQLVDVVGSKTGLTDDVEGMSIYHGADGAKYLVVSSQGSNRYVLYDLNAGGKAVLNLDIDKNPANGVDGVSETDGVDVSGVALGDDYPLGILVVQDGFNHHPDENQNFKIIDWRDVARGIAKGD